jgi:hypothetical protein
LAAFAASAVGESIVASAICASPFLADSSDEGSLGWLMTLNIDAL